MEVNEQLHLSCFEIISQVGMARSCYIEAMDLASAGDIEQVRTKAAEGDGFFSAGHTVHAQLITQAAQGEPVPVDILLVHAEDQLMSAGEFKILTERFINMARQACAKR